jgi:hypothetical protein
MKKSTMIIACSVLLLFCLQTEGFQTSETQKAQYPLLTTSAGQSPDVETVNIICEEAGIMYDYCDVVTAELIEMGVGLAGEEERVGFHMEVNTDFEKFPKGTPYKTLIIAIGASLKGMGASGLTVNDEVARLKEIIDYCKKNGIFIIGAHVGGSSKRGAPGGDNERMIDAVAPFCDYLIITSDGNKDGRFDKISEDNTIPLTEIEYALELVDILKKMFE